APAGLVALGWPVTLLGFALLALALGGFRSIKQPTASGRAGAERLRVAASVGARAANNLWEGKHEGSRTGARRRRLDGRGRRAGGERRDDGAPGGGAGGVRHLACRDHGPE